MNKSIERCNVCGGLEIIDSIVLWPELISTWQISQVEVNYINRQQGTHCKNCGSNLRAMGLSAAILREYKYYCTLNQFCLSQSKIDILEINQAGLLTQFFKKHKSHKLIEYPEFDMLDLKIDAESYDLVVHSDTLEHIPYPARALSECYRVLRATGICIFTVPIILNRMNRSRIGLEPSYHGQSGVLANDQLVYTEFGANIWQVVIEAGFSSCELYAFEYPAALTIIARK